MAQSLVDLLEDSGFEVMHIANGQSALNATFKEKFDLYLLDINVPIIDGISLLGELRGANDSTPTLFLTSHHDKEMLKKAFLNGGDDFMSKPFDVEELLLRINALLKRAGIAATPSSSLYHDSVHKRILYNKRELELTKKEYRLLLLLMKHIDKTVPKELLLQELWSSQEDGSFGAIRVYINRIKQLVPELNIQNIRGIGYKLVS